MISQILSHTSIWVWLLLAALCALGWNQTRTRALSLKRMIIVPLVMLGLSMSSLSNAFGAHVPVLLTWFASMACIAILMRRLRLPSGHAYDAQSQLFTVPGSFVPLVMILSIFVTKYVLAVSLAMQPNLAHQLSFSIGCAAVFGMMNGVFFGRALRLMRLYQSKRDFVAEVHIPFPNHSCLGDEAKTVQ
ncbi:MAG: hypothetical protein HYR92_06880 [Burkholderiales bacterium]|nr:hypothetical protein [Burkholderiales bacterium]